MAPRTRAGDGKRKRDEKPKDEPKAEKDDRDMPGGETGAQQEQPIDGVAKEEGPKKVGDKEEGIKEEGTVKEEGKLKS